MAAYFKSALWLLGCGGLGYLLLEVTTPNEEYFEKAKKTYPGIEKSPVEALKKKQQFVDVLKAVSETDKAVHTLTKEEIEKLHSDKSEK